MIKKFEQLNRGVSPAVGTLLLVAVTIIIATGIAVFVFNIGFSSPVTAGVEIQEKGNNSVEVMWTDSGNADELLVNINGVNQSTLSDVSDSTSFSYNNGDTVSVVGVTEDNTSIITSEKFGFKTVADETDTPSNKLLASSKEDAHGVLLLTGDITSEAESDIQFTVNNEPVNADGTWTINSTKYFKFYINNYEGEQDYVVGAEPIDNTVYSPYVFKSSYLSSLNDSSEFSDLDKDFVAGSINSDSSTTVSNYESYQSASGIGTESNPKQLTSITEFKGVPNSGEIHLVLQKNIDGGGSSVSMTKVSELDGSGYTISNIDVTDNILLKGNVKNINFDSVSSEGGPRSYLLSNGEFTDITIQNSSLSSTMTEGAGDFTGSGDYSAYISPIKEADSVSKVNVLDTTLTVNNGGLSSGDDVHLIVGGIIEENRNTISDSEFSGSIIIDFNVTDTSSNIGYNSIGGITGQNDSSIINSNSTGSITAKNIPSIGLDLPVGGLVGDNRGTISDSSSTASVSGNNEVGGLVGDNRGTISDSYSAGSVSGENFVGGLIGSNIGTNNRDVTVKNSYSTASVSGNFDVGGLIGDISSSDSSVTIENTYSNSNITVKTDDGVSPSDFGGLIGNLDDGIDDSGNPVNLSNSYASGSMEDINKESQGGLIGSIDGNMNTSALYWDTESLGQSTTANGIGTGLTTSEMSGSSASSNMSGFDYTNTWTTVTGDYPELQE